MIDLRLLTQFRAVAKHLHFRKAADELHMAQPPLSQAIKRLEDTLGVQLLERTKKQVKLTTAGAVFLAEAEKTLAQARRAEDMARAADQGSIGKLAIGFVGSATYRVLPTLLRDFHDRHPTVELELNEMTTLQQFQALAQGRIQVGFLRPPLPFDQSLSMRVIDRERLLPILPRSHPLADTPTLSLKDLAEEKLITFPAAAVPSVFTQIMLACKEAGFAPAVAQTALQIQTMISLVAGGIGISLVPEGARAALHDGVVMRELADFPPLLAIDLAIAWPSDLRVPVFTHFLDTCDRHFPDAGPDLAVPGRRRPPPSLRS